MSLIWKESAIASRQRVLSIVWFCRLSRPRTASFLSSTASRRMGRQQGFGESGTVP